jgi:RNA polymerase sigma factor (sigma-70 family)
MAGFQEKRAVLLDALEHHSDEFLGTILVYLRRFGCCGPPTRLRDAAFEVLSETAVTTLQPRLVNRFDPEIGVAAAWIKTIAFNKTMSFLKRERRWKKREQKNDRTSGGEMDAFSVTDDEWLTRLSFRLSCPHDPRADVDEILSSLDSSDRDILSLHYLDGYSGKELADQLGIKSGAAYVRLSRARQRARQAAVAVA